jgi:hypothetical protein
VPSITSIRAKLPAIKRLFGAPSAEYIGALLQTSIVGLRDNLGSVRITDSEDEASPNFYNPATGHLVIRDFKTRGLFPPYDQILDNKLRKEVASSLEKRKRTHLVSARGGSIGTVISRAFSAVGLQVGVMTIRHSMETALLSVRNGASAANVKRVADQFKHSTDTASRYFRLTSPASYDDDEEMTGHAGAGTSANPPTTRRPGLRPRRA